jgi:hypothetical protein
VGYGAPHERGAASMLELPRNDTQGTSSPQHANTLAGGTRGRPALTKAVMLHCSTTQSPTCCSVQPLQHANPVRSTQAPTTGGTYLHLGPNVAGLIHTQGG